MDIQHIIPHEKEEEEDAEENKGFSIGRKGKNIARKDGEDSHIDIPEHVDAHQLRTTEIHAQSERNGDENQQEREVAGNGRGHEFRETERAEKIHRDNVTYTRSLPPTYLFVIPAFVGMANQRLSSLGIRLWLL